VEELKSLVVRAQAGDLEGYGEIVRRFQDMAYGYAYSVLGDFHLAEDAAQEGFVEAYGCLANLREPAAFPGWFRRVIFKHCDRITRKRRPEKGAVEELGATPSEEPGPSKVAERREMRDTVLRAIRALPEDQRTATTLFYINGYSQEEIADFLEVTVAAVKSRLQASRRRLRRMLAMVADELKGQALPPEFPERIRLLLGLPRPLETEGHPVREMWNIFRSCFPDFVVVELDELLDKSIALFSLEDSAERVYQADSQRILRPELTSQMFDLWLSRGGGRCRWITVGRVFRGGQNVSPTNLEVHHQAEVLWGEEGLDERLCAENILDVGAKLLPRKEVHVGTPCAYPPVPNGRYYVAPWRGKWLNVAAGGMVAHEWVAKGGLDPKRCGMLSFAFGLERCAQVRHDLDDIRTLWQPPYVPD